MIIHLENINDFEKIINENNKLIIDFFASWCGPCKMLSPMLEKVASVKPDWTVLKIDVDQFGQLGQKFAVQAVPTLVFIVNQNVKEISVGFKSDAQLLKIVDKF